MILNIDGFEFNNKEPIYLQIIELIKKNIALGVLKADDKLPSVRELSKELGVNPNTIQRAYGDLERLGITYTKRGMGSFISNGEDEGIKLKESMGKQIAEKFIEDMKSIGIEKGEAINILNGLEE